MIHLLPNTRHAGPRFNASLVGPKIFNDFLLGGLRHYLALMSNQTAVPAVKIICDGNP
jgi:hypothetical protein